MKTTICILGLVLAAGLTAPAALSYSYASTSAAIPDNNTIGTGDNLVCTVAGGGTAISDLTLTFTLQGGFASDLTGYLRLGNATGSPAFDLTSLIQGQTLNESSPNTYTIDFTTSSAFQSTFSGLNPNDAWTLFFADTSPGGNTTVNSWSLDVTASAVPEPVNMALGIFALIFSGAGILWSRRGSRRNLIAVETNSITPHHP